MITHLNEKQLRVMLDMQNTLNKTVNPDWVNLGWDYMRASMLEGAEAVEHHGWKWWKFQQKDLPQLQMELIDIWHFYLSRYIQINAGHEEASLAHVLRDFSTQMNEEVIFDGESYHLPELSTLDKLDLLIGLSASKRMNLNVFFSLCHDCDIPWVSLFELYIKKNILNIFRQKNGYRQGTYLKEWFDKEDNVTLVEEASKFDPMHDNYATDLWAALETKYQEALVFQANKVKNTH